MTIKIEYERSFLQLFTDSITLHQHAEQYRESKDFRRTLFRASILNTLLIPEVVANICIEHLSLEKSVYAEIDRLSFLAKYDYYLRTKFRNRSLDRGIVEIEKLKELKKLRDSYVHPKRTEIYWDVDKNGSGTGSCNKTNLLKINKSTSFWEQEDSLQSMIAVHSFLNYFFVKKCRYSKNKVGSLLFSVSKDPNDKDYITPGLPNFIKSALAKNNINLNYVKIMRM
jgi:hypothetical protein